MGDDFHSETNAERLSELTLAHLDGRIGDDDFEELRDRLQDDPEARATYVKLARLDSGLRDAGLGESESGELIDFPDRRPQRAKGAVAWKIAAAVAILGAASWMIFQAVRPGDPPGLVSDQPADSKTSLGVAVITAEAGAVWEKIADHSPGDGVSLEAGTVILREGLAQIDFFGGASITLSGPAELELISRDAAILRRGRLKADVPPAARGFEIRTGDILLEDLGTSFGLAVGDDDRADLVVFDGEVRATGMDGKPLSLLGGDSARLQNGEAIPQGSVDAGTFPDISEVFAGSGDREETRYAAWKEASLELRNDPRLIAYYDFENLTLVSRRLKNRAISGMGSELDGGIVGARVANGRWPRKTSLDFRQEGDRVRFQIPGEFDALTIFAWVRIDALDRGLNSLFLTDYFDPREFHWQISREGALHFATSPMGVEDLPKHNRRFYSEPFWTPEQSGNWFLLATTVEGGAGRLTHYINGKAVGFSGGTNREKPLPRMRIGGADLGNWSDPIWPEVSIRTLNGRIDEFALFDAALSASEIQSIYDQGKP